MPKEKMFFQGKEGADERMWPKDKDGPRDSSLGRRWGQGDDFALGKG
jgi:hypothetical protein